MVFLFSSFWRVFSISKPVFLFWIKIFVLGRVGGNEPNSGMAAFEGFKGWSLYRDRLIGPTKLPFLTK